MDINSQSRPSIPINLIVDARSIAVVVTPSMGSAGTSIGLVLCCFVLTYTIFI